MGADAGRPHEALLCCGATNELAQGVANDYCAVQQGRRIIDEVQTVSEAEAIPDPKPAAKATAPRSPRKGSVKPMAEATPADPLASIASVMAAAEAPVEAIPQIVEEAVAVTEDIAVAPVEPGFSAGERAESIEAVTSPAVESDPIPAEPAPLASANEEGTNDMATTSETAGFATDKFQSLFSDMGQRFKSSFEKSAKLGEEMVDLTKGNVEAVVASARVAAKGSEQLGQEAVDYGKKSLESAVAAMRGFASVKSPTELFQLQSEFAKSSFDSAVAQASKLSESMLKLAGEVAQPLSSRYAVAAEKIKSAAL